MYAIDPCLDWNVVALKLDHAVHRFLVLILLTWD